MRARGATRATLLVALAALLVAGAQPGPAGAAKKPAKRASERCAQQGRCAKLRRHAVRPPVERLVDRSVPVTPAPDPGPGQPDPGAPALPSFVSVSAREFSLTLSRPLVGAGAVRIELRNVGEDPHNLVVNPEGQGNALAAFDVLDPGAYQRKTVALEPGRYRLWCSLELHEGYGMSTTLRVQ
jgi:hypothetical protein